MFRKLQFIYFSRNGLHHFSVKPVIRPDISDTAEGYMVHRMDGIITWFLFIGRSVGYHVASGHNIYFPAGKYFLQPL